jgi:pSer/pThr/pTyr-binding forkhead associated (FHA) protein
MSEQLVELFRRACGARGPLELRLLGPDGEPPRDLVLEQPFALVGRDPGNDVPLDGETISHRHALLQMIGGRLFFLDLGSRSGMCLQNCPQACGWLGLWEAIQIGGYTIRLPPNRGASVSPAPAGPFEPTSPIARCPADQPLVPGVSLEITQGREKPFQKRLNRVLTLVGRSPVCKLQLADDSVSRFHCSLLHTHEGVWAVDLLAREGILVNGNRVRWARLAHGDELQVGNFVLRACYDAGGGSLAGKLVPWSATTSAASRHLVPAQLPRRAVVEESLLAPIVQQFQLMQQQMFDQFQETMRMVVQVFSNLHREQMSLVREELDQLHRVTAELRSLQGQLANGAQANRGPAPSQAAAAAVPARGVAGSTPAASHAHQSAAAAVGGQGPPAAAQSPSSAATSRPAAGPPEDGNPSEIAGPEIHAWLTGRIAALQQERQGRLQRILNLVRGK